MKKYLGGRCNGEITLASVEVELIYGGGMHVVRAVHNLYYKQPDGLGRIEGAYFTDEESKTVLFDTFAQARDVVREFFNQTLNDLYGAVQWTAAQVDLLTELTE